ncbi:putative proteasome subunit beta type-4 [Wickerhamiella sorbophila]|uniref:Putative proteasome subunit beta type-4 n=1 Tax=Wickerhamiella sorbophila TaxID=45607 RepID=A0A2T0FHH3_9ASCO|nr:putative proteasome subunit beta type-4 [Wickerhamiella sorbophila]PRT54407.1 putative proteasome subunit beta type-4 [Wickerhamiella sorbophila]
MDILIGLQTANEVILVTSRAISRGVSVLKHDDNKVVKLNSYTAMAYSGEPGDVSNFAEYIQANVALYGLRHGIEMTPNSVAAFTRSELARSLRTRKPYQVNLLIGGFHPREAKPMLAWVDYLGSKVDLPYAAHGYAAYYITATLDRYWKKGLTLEQGLKLAAQCVSELQTRMPIDFKGCDVHIVGKSGIQSADLPPIVVAPGVANKPSEATLASA